MSRRARAPFDKVPKREKFNFEAMKASAAHADRGIRKAAFIEYFERFGEFPSFLFETESAVDARLLETIQDLLKDEETSKEMRKGIEALIERLPS